MPSRAEVERALAAMAPPSTPHEALSLAPNLARFLAKLDSLTTITTLAGLMTDPALQVNGIRLDWALRLAVALTEGRKRPRREDFSKLLNAHLVEARVDRLEDPIEDFFVERVPTPRGEGLIFSGQWPNAAHHTESVLAAFTNLPDGGPKSEALNCFYSLLRLADALVRRSHGFAGQIGAGSPWKPVKLPFDKQLAVLRERVCFSFEEIAELGIRMSALDPFLLPDEARPLVVNAVPGDSLLDFRPLIKTETGIVAAAPASITTALRGLLIHTAVKGGMRKALCAYLLEEHTTRIEESGFIEIQGTIQAIGDVCLVRNGLFELSRGRWVHVLQVADGFAGWPDHAFGTMPMAPPVVNAEILKSICGAKAFMEQQENFVEGMTLLIQGGWGSMQVVQPGYAADLVDWPIILLEPADAIVLGGCEGGDLIDVWRMDKIARRVEAQGFSFLGVNGILNLFQWWRDNDHELVPPRQLDIAPPMTLHFDLNLHLKAREEALRGLDRHSLLHPDGTHKLVRRYESHTLTGELEPNYVCVASVNAGHALAAFTYEDQVWWLELLNPPGHEDSANAIETWKAAAKWLALTMPAFVAAYGVASGAPLMVRLDVKTGKARIDKPLSNAEIADAVVLTFEDDGKGGIVTLLPRWGDALYRPDNKAEMTLGVRLLEGMAAMAGIQCTPSELEGLVATSAGSPDIRWRHLFQMRGPVDRLTALGLVGSFHNISESSGALAKCGAAWMTRSRAEGGHIEGKSQCINFLIKHTNERFAAFRRCVGLYNRNMLVVGTLDEFQRALREQRHWQMTARAMRGIHGIEKDKEISLTRSQQINAVIRGASIVVEVAAAEGSASGGRLAGPVDLNELQAQATLYFHDIDTLAALHGDRIKPELGLSPTGDVLHDHSFEEQTLHAPVERHHREIREDASQTYLSRFQEEGPAAEPSEELLKAIEAEYGVPAQILVDLPYALVDVAESLKSGVIVRRRSELIASLSVIDAMKNGDIEKLIDRLTLPARSGWDDVPPNCTKADFDLGKFDRRYSLIARPIVALSAGDDPELAVAPALLERTLHHNLGGANTGMLQNEFWTTRAMQAFASKRGSITGLEFNDEVARELAVIGLKAWPSAKPSWCLNMKATDALKGLGDIDVLAVSPDGHVVWVIEVKDLKLCRTRGEVARRLSSYRGKLTVKGRPDDMMRHLRRVEFIRQHGEKLVNRLNLPGAPSRICGAVIVRAPQPMEQFATEVPPDGRVVMLDDTGSIPWNAGWNGES